MTLIAYRTLNNIDGIDPILSLGYWGVFFGILSRERDAQPAAIIIPSNLEESGITELEIPRLNLLDPEYAVISYIKLMNTYTLVEPSTPLIVDDVFVPNKRSLEDTIVEIVNQIFICGGDVNSARIIMPDKSGNERLIDRLKGLESKYRALISGENKQPEKKLVKGMEKLARNEIELLKRLNYICKELLAKYQETA